MNVKNMTAAQIRTAAYEAVLNELGPAGLIRFLQQFDPGHGDYTAERKELLGNPSVDELADEIIAWRKRKGV